MKQNTVILGGVAVLGVLCLAFPPIHIRSLAKTRATQASTQFNAKDFAAQFWQARLLPAVEKAADAEQLVAAIAASKENARKQFGRTVGMGNSYYFFLRGSGWVVKVENDSIGLSLKANGEEVDVAVPLGLVFGNALRDATGLLNASDYSNSQNFNDIAASLNHLAETQVLPELQRIAVVGKRVQFAGGVEVADEDEDLKPLKLVPIFVKAE